MKLMRIMLSILLVSFCLLHNIQAVHFRGGMIGFRPAMNTTSVLHTERTLLIDQRYMWSRRAAASSCTSTTIVSFGLIGEAAISVLTCESPAATCTSILNPTPISTYVPCTDYNTVLGMSFGYSSTSVNVTVVSSGVVLGYVVSGAWLTLQLGGGGWSMMTYINTAPRSDNHLINSSPTSSIAPIVYTPAGLTQSSIIDIPMSDSDGDDIQCRFALASNVLGGVTVNECSGVCRPSALPASTQLISGNNTCTLIVNLVSFGYYAVAIQLEDFISNTTTTLSSVPLQFLLLAYDASNPMSTCTLIPVITSIPPDFPLPGSTVTVQVTVLYTAMVIAETGCVNDTDAIIVNFITSSPPGMVKTNLPFALASPSYAINLTWTPTINQLGQTFTFCAIAIDSNYYSSNQYCFYLLVGPRTTTTTTTSTTSTSVTTSTSTTSTSTSSSTSATTTSVTSTTTTSTTSSTTTVKAYNYIPLALGLGLGLGLPLLLLLSLLALCYLCRWCPYPLRSIIRRRYGHRQDMYCPHCQRSTLFDDPQKEDKLKCNASKGTCAQYRQQYINTSDDQSSLRPSTSYLEREYYSSRRSDLALSLSYPLTTTVTSLLSPSVNTLPTENVSRVLSPPATSSYSLLSQHSSILVQKYTKQMQSV